MPSNKNDFFYIIGTNRLDMKIANLVPFSSQVFDIDEKRTLEFNYPDDHDYLLHITCINGEGEVTFNDISYKLKGIHDSIIITINADDASKDGKKILATSLNETEGFNIYTEYNIRPATENFDEIRYGENADVVITDDDLPLILYSKLYKAEDITFSFKFNEAKVREDEEHKFDISVLGGVVGYDQVIKKRNDPSFDLNCNKTGKFDKKGVGLLTLSRGEILDRSGNILATTESSFNLELYKTKSDYFESIKEFIINLNYSYKNASDG